MRTLKIFLFLILFQFAFSSTLYASGILHPYLLERMLRPYRYFLVVKIDQRIMILMDNKGKEISRYPIAVPALKKPYPLPLIGTLKRIEFNPVWHPTLKTRAAYLKKKGVILPDFIKPNDPQNAMGKVKFVMEFIDLKEPIRIHGTNDPKSIGKRVSRGCIRMYNNDALSLAKILKNSKLLVIFEK